MAVNLCKAAAGILWGGLLCLRLRASGGSAGVKRA